jgi:hypothetical protein
MVTVRDMVFLGDHLCHCGVCDISDFVLIIQGQFDECGIHMLHRCRR